MLKKKSQKMILFQSSIATTFRSLSMNPKATRALVQFHFLWVLSQDNWAIIYPLAISTLLLRNSEIIPYLLYQGRQKELFL
jgi:hypothetical protein